MKQPTFSYHTHLIFSISKNSWNSFALWLPVKTSKTFLPFLNYLLEKLKTKVYRSTEVVPWDGGLDLYISYKTKQVSDLISSTSFLEENTQSYQNTSRLYIEMLVLDFQEEKMFLLKMIGIFHNSPAVQHSGSVTRKQESTGIFIDEFMEWGSWPISLG